MYDLVWDSYPLSGVGGGMKRIEWYLFRNAALASLVTLLALLGMIWVTQAIRQLDLVTGKGQTLLLFFHATLLIIPQLMLIILPIALFVGALVTLNRSNADSELVVMSAAGVRPLALAKPFIILALLGLVVSYALSTYILPQSSRTLREIIVKVRTDVITRILEEGRFVEIDKGVVFHYRAKDPQGALLGVLLQDRRGKDLITTFTAEKGVITPIGDSDYLILSNGQMQRQSLDGEDQPIVTFAQYAFDLSALSGGPAKVVYFWRERPTTELIGMVSEIDKFRKDEGPIKAELNDRFAIPLYALAAVAIAFAALGKPRTTRQGRAATIITASAALIITRIAAFGAFTLVTGNPSTVPVMYALPLIVTIICLFIAFAPARSAVRSRPLTAGAPA